MTGVKHLFQIIEYRNIGRSICYNQENLFTRKETGGLLIQTKLYIHLSSNVSGKVKTMKTKLNLIAAKS